MKESQRIDYLQQLVDVLRSNPFHAKMCMSPTLFKNYNQDKALASAIQARILRPRQLTQNDNPVFNFAALDGTGNVTARRSKRLKLDVEGRRSSVEPLNPELIYKVRFQAFV